MSQLSEDIKRQLIKDTERKLSKMQEDKKQTPSLIIPKSLLSFAKSQIYQTFLFTIYDYCMSFNEIIKKYETLKQKMENRVGENIIYSQKERQNLVKQERQLSYQYAQILLDHACKSIFKDQFFFETLIYLISKVIKDLFVREEFLIIEECINNIYVEINRLFRTNRFNLIKKRHQNDQIMKDFPALKEENRKHKFNIATLINKAPEKITAFKTLEKQRKKGKLGFDYTSIIGVSEIKDELQRSPLLCTWLPSKKTMLNDFSTPKYSSLLKMKSSSPHSSMTMEANQNEEV